MILDDVSKFIIGLTVNYQIRLPLLEQSDLGLHSLGEAFLTTIMILIGI